MLARLAKAWSPPKNGAGHCKHSNDDLACQTQGLWVEFDAPHLCRMAARRKEIFLAQGGLRYFLRWK